MSYDVNKFNPPGREAVTKAMDQAMLEMRADINRCNGVIKNHPGRAAKCFRRRKRRVVALAVEGFNRSRPHGPTERIIENKQKVQARHERIIKRKARTVAFRASKPIFE